MMYQPQPVDSGTVVFAPRARLLKLIGAELISDEVVAITELVKNAHDADASVVTVQFSGSSEDGGEIIIRDDGHGMDVDALLTRWMQPAGSLKGRRDSRFTAGGRRLLGEKGVGRFATDKLAAHLELVSRAAGSDREVRAVFDWDEFDRDERMLSDVSSRWELRAPDWLEHQGTALRLSGLRTRWNERMFRRLAARLGRLISPFGGPSSFRIVIESDEFPEYSGDVGASFVASAPYKVEADFDGAETVTMRVNGGRAVKRRWNADQALRCGPVRTRLHAFDLETEALARIGPRVDVRGWLREWSGVSVYRDGFRVWPYGEPHDDWLRLDQRRVNNPVVRLSNNQIVGFVEISRDGNPELRDQTNREGLIHNEQLADLQSFILFALQQLEAERQSVRHPQGKKKDRRLSRSTNNPDYIGLPETIERLATKTGGELATELRRAAANARTQIATQEAARRRLLDGYSELAALGHSSALAGRGVEIGLDVLRKRITNLRSAVESGKVSDFGKLLAQVEECQHAFAEVSTRHAHVTAAPQSASKRRRGIDVVTELERVRNMLAPVLLEEGAHLEIKAPQGEVLRTDVRPESFAAVIQALVRNSLEWRSTSRAARIVISVAVVGDDVAISYSDSGTGVSPELEGTLFEPQVSGREGAPGMGLTLARQIIVTNGGKIGLVVDGRRKGARFDLTLPRKRSRATQA